jgi:hypothetical protein
MKQLDHQGWANIITHVHTEASSAETSVLNDRISAVIRRFAGEESPISWSECFIGIDQLEELLQRGHGNHWPVHMILVTDHMRLRSHRLLDGHLAAAARTQRLALGAELATRTRDTDGEYHDGPEILAYGGPHLVQGPHGPYYGLPQELIDEIYDTCLADDGEDLCTRRTRDFLCRRGIAHALSHPLDGHALSLEATLDIISEFAFVETLNGGYSARSARMLDAFVRVNNALVAGAILPLQDLGPTGRRIVRHIQRHGRTIQPWAGSDAHHRDFDRVVTAMAMPEGRRAEDLTPGDLLATMIAQGSRPRRRQECDAPERSSFVPLGRAATPLSLLADVSAIVIRNFRDVVRQCKNPVTLSGIAASTISITRDELRWRRELQRKRVRQMMDDFDPARLLPLLSVPAQESTESVLDEDWAAVSI